MAFNICKHLKVSRTVIRYIFEDNCFARLIGPHGTVYTPQAYSYKLCNYCSIANHTKESKYIRSRNVDIQNILLQNMTVYPDFISEEEEKSFVDEVDRYMRRRRYEFDHWDNAIHGYRETEKKTWNASNQGIIDRVQEMVFTKCSSPLAYVHVLDLAKEGYIKPHVDSVRFCGDTITGLCLLSSCVMRLALESDSSRYGDILLPQRCLYVMRGRARYDFTHEVLKDEESYFSEQHIRRDRRISVICRNEPNQEDTL